MANGDVPSECEQDLADLKAVFDLCYEADMRAIKKWQDATGKSLVWPDSANLTGWLLEQIDKLEEDLEDCRNERDDLEEQLEEVRECVEA